MGDLEKKVIDANLVELVNCTQCNVTLLQNLKTANVLSDEDIQDVEAEITNLKKANKFYKIIVAKEFFLQKLKNAFKITNQSKALQILKSSENDLDKNYIIGQGSYGCVYKSEHLGMDVAIKRLQIDATKFVEREINILKKYSKHDNIVRFMGSGTTDKYFLVYMELCDMNLKYWVANKHPIKIEPLEVLRQITVGLGWLHGCNIVHMDLKPENILFTSLPERVKISDFGFSRQIADGQSCVSTIDAGGTLGWCAPEIYDQAREEAEGNYKYIYKTSSDIFSLGCIYYYVLSNGKHAFGQGPFGMLHANIIHNKCFIKKDQLLHGCKQNVFLILLMVSRNVNSRPTCTTLLSSPLFWSKDRSCKFIYDLLTYDYEILSSVLHSKERMKCNLEHKEENDMLITVNKTGDKGDGCVIVMAYLKCKNTKGVLGRYYNGVNSFDINELKISECTNSTLSDFVKASNNEVACESEEETLFQLVNNTYKEFEQLIIESFDYSLQQGLDTCVINTFQSIYQRVLDAVLYNMLDVPEVQKMQICKLLRVKSEAFRAVLGRTIKIATNFHSSVNALMNVNVCFPKDKITNKISKLLDMETVKSVKYAQNVCKGLSNFYISQNNCIAEFEERLLIHFYEEVVAGFKNNMDSNLTSHKIYSTIYLKRIYSTLASKYVAKFKDFWRREADENSSVTSFYVGVESELKIRLKASYMEYQFSNRAKLKKRYNQVMPLIMKYNDIYCSEMNKFPMGILHMTFENMSLITLKNLIEPFDLEVRRIIEETEPIDWYLKTLQLHLEALQSKYLDLNNQILKTPNEARRPTQDMSLPKNIPIIFQLTLLKIRTWFFCNEKLMDFGYSSTTIGETTNGLLLCEHQLTDQTNKSEFQRSWNLNDCLFPNNCNTTDDEILLGETSYKMRAELVLGLLFYTLKQKVEACHNGKVTECVVTIPFWLTSTQRQKVKDSGKVAGFEKTLLVNENSVIAYQFCRSNFDNRRNDVVVLSENSGRIDSTVYSYNKFVGSVTMTGYCVQYENNSQSGVNPTIKARIITEGYRIAQEMSAARLTFPELYGFIWLYGFNRFLRPQSKTVAVSFYSEEYKNILTNIGNDIDTTGRVSGVNEDMIAFGAFYITENQQRISGMQDVLSASIFRQICSSPEAEVVKEGRNLKVDSETLKVMDSFILGKETAYFYQNDVNGQRSLICSLKLDSPDGEVWVEVQFEVSRESIVSLPILKYPNVKVILNQGKLTEQQIFSYTCLLESFQKLREIEEKSKETNN